LLKTPKGRESLEIFAQRRTVVGMITILSAIGVRDQERAETILLRLDGVAVWKPSRSG